jgi:hypothetical protein
MTCFFHTWGWPRRRGETDYQVCARCGSERLSKVQFRGSPVQRNPSDTIKQVVVPACRTMRVRRAA